MRPKREVIVGGVYKHIDGGLYKVDRIILNATHYERRLWGRRVRESVAYTQLSPRAYPQGQEWVRSKKDFLRYKRRFPQFWKADPLFTFLRRG